MGALYVGVELALKCPMEDEGMAEEALPLVLGCLLGLTTTVVMTVVTEVIMLEIVPVVVVAGKYPNDP